MASLNWNNMLYGKGDFMIIFADNILQFNMLSLTIRQNLSMHYI